MATHGSQRPSEIQLRVPLIMVEPGLGIEKYARLRRIMTF